MQHAHEAHIAVWHRYRIQVFAVALLWLSAASASAVAADTNLALNRLATGSAPCASTETPERAVNGTVNLGNYDKFCSAVASPWLQVDLGAAVSIDGFVIAHAGAGGESSSLNSKAFNIQLSQDGINWSTVVTVSNNSASTSTHSIAATTARYARLNITVPTQTSDKAARIYEFQVSGSGTQPGGSVAVFDQIPMYGIYTSSDPVGYTPPTGVLMWNRGTEFVRKLSSDEKTLLGDDLRVRVTYHAQCDNYDRIGTVFYISMPQGQAPIATTPRITLQDFITPFSDYWQGSKATYVYNDGNLASYADAMSDPDRDIWVGIGSGSNPYGGDPCDSHSNLSADFKAVGFTYSLSLISSQTETALDRNIDTMLSGSNETSSQISASTVTQSVTNHSGDIALVIGAYGASDGGEEYSNTSVDVTVNGTKVGSLNTAVDCADLGQYSPDGNPGIFQNNTQGNPRNWCPGGIIATHYFPVSNLSAEQDVSVSLDIGRPSPYTSDSYYRTSLSLIEH
ncbi:discoidin domain-containing protein [Dyella silvatica]|uniref:discoidin domain-containing protein n=1 Tax=Dyella silvatica TaxID=2992128 RepID=UPI0022515F9C|nr:discoidin domain-containing protein [Dyella silvatica]